MSLPSIPYFIGCPSWSENAWREYLYPADASAAQMLGLYSQVFNAVEGNTTFYARPSPATVVRWAATMPAHFRFTAKFPATSATVATCATISNLPLTSFA